MNQINDMRKRILIIALMGILVGTCWSCSKEAEQEQGGGVDYHELHEGDPGWEEFE